jgi:hypothetical protein
MIFGIVLTLLLLFFLSVLRLFLSRFTNRTFSQVIPYLRADHPEIIAELLNPQTEYQLSHALTRKQFRKEQLNRISLTLEHLGRRAHNATVWQEWGDSERRKSRNTHDLEVRAAAENLVESCVEFRIGVSAVQIQLHLWQFKLILLPFAKVPRISRLRKTDEFDLLESYKRIQQAALKLAEACGGDCRERLAQAL